MNQMDPMSNWRVKYGRRNVYHLVGMSMSNYVGYPANNTDPWPAFPVTVNDDQSFTIGAMEGKNNQGVDDKFYPNAVEMTYKGASPAAGCLIVSDLKLTKGWTEDAKLAGLGVANYTGKSILSAIDGKYTPKARPAARTPFVKAPRNMKNVVLTPVNYEQAQKNIKATFNKMLKKISSRK